jgi:AraC family L-rhamnose operon regulatory protein RhaS
MELSTIGKEIYPGTEVKLWCNPQESFAPLAGAENRLHLVLVEEGSGILCLNDGQIACNAPILLCLNEHEPLTLIKGASLKARGMYFHPAVINSAFSFQNIRQAPDGEFRFTDIQDQYWLQAFIDRGPQRNGLFSLAPITANRIKHQMILIDQELDEQRDGFWPCRSRSYLLELLFLIDRLYREPQSADIGVLAQVETTDEIGEVILYLHTHYQEKITLAGLACHFNTNRTTLTRQFRAATGLPVMTYLINLRVHLASLMLRNTTLSVTEVMQRVGFIDDTHFTRTFRKHTRTTPSEYRQRYCWMVE